MGRKDSSPREGSLGNLLLNGDSFLGVLSKALQSHLKFVQLFSGGGGSAVWCHWLTVAVIYF